MKKMLILIVVCACIEHNPGLLTGNGEHWFDDAVSGMIDGMNDVNWEDN